MANSRQSVTIFSPSSKRPTKRTRSSITEHSFQGITPSPRGGSFTHVSGTNCHPCVRPLRSSMTYQCGYPFCYRILNISLASQYWLFIRESHVKIFKMFVICSTERFAQIRVGLHTGKAGAKDFLLNGHNLRPAL